MLTKLAPFGGSSHKIETLGQAAFGISLLATLPEDRFDRQPLTSRRRWLLAADIRLDNRSDLEHLLQGDWRERADSEILLEALLRWGEAALHRLVGDFAFALFDATTKSLLLARDASGQRPLYYAVGNGFAAFASMASALAGSPGVGRELDAESLVRGMSDIPLDGDRSYFRAVRKIRPGQLVRIWGRNVEVRDVWKPQIQDWVNRPDFVEGYRSVLDEAVSARLRRIEDLAAAQLSSGLDSSAVLSSAVGQAGSGKLAALTSAPGDTSGLTVPPGRIVDESALAADIARFLDVRHIVVRDASSSMAHFRRQAAIFQEPNRNHTNYGWLSGLGRTARNLGCRVMLTGDAGNLTLNAGSLANLRELRRARGWVFWGREAWLATHGGGARWTGVLINSFGHHLPQLAVRRLERRFQSARQRDAATFVRRPVAEQFVRPALPLPHERRSASSYDDRLRLLRSLDWGNHNKGMLAETGMDMRHPLMDRRVIEFSFTIPPDEFFRDGRSRSLARRALTGRVPANILSMRDRGYQAADWYQRASREEMLEMVEEIEASHVASEVLDLDRMRATIERWDRIDFSDMAQNIAIDTYLSLALAGGLFIVEAERGFSG